MLGEAVYVWGQGVYGKTLPSSFVVDLKLFLLKNVFRENERPPLLKNRSFS